MIKRIFSNLYFLMFLNGLLIASMAYIKMESTYEDELFQAIRNDIDRKLGPRDNADSLLVRVTHACHELLVQRGTVFQGVEFAGLKSEIFQPVTIDLMTARGACGSYAVVLARMLDSYGFPVRVAQMKAGGVFAAHNLVEVQTRHGWVVLDALYDLSFRKPAHGLASFAEVGQNWVFYSKQLPVGYNSVYRYEGVRYCNWTKVPLVFPGIKKMLDLVLGKERADGICIRSWFLKTYDFAFAVITGFFLLIFPLTLLMWFRTTVFARQLVPLTFPNVLRQLRVRLQEVLAPHGQH